MFMNPSACILLVEGSEPDVAAAAGLLQSSGYNLECRRVETGGEIGVKPAHRTEVFHVADSDRHRLWHHLNERMKELSALHQAARLFQQKELTTEAVLEHVVHLLGVSMQYPAITVVRAVFDRHSAATEGFVRTPWGISSGFKTDKGQVGWLEVYYLEECSVEGENAFLQEEQTLLQSMAEFLAAYFQRREDMKQLRALAAHLQSVREEEARRVAREMHDELGQALTGMQMDLHWLQRRVPKLIDLGSQLPIQSRFESLEQLLEKTLGNVRKICAELRPEILDNIGLNSALDWQANDFQQRTGITCRLDLPAEELSLEPEESTALFRIFQEILTNIARHARASKVDVVFSGRTEDCELIVSDNGRGITQEELGDPKSLGLLGMKERALAIGGRVDIEGKRGQGTKIRVLVPRLPI
jgi:signal transduction histidine kinase